MSVEANRPKTILIANQKGGVGKTVTSMGLAHILSTKGKVLAIDLDPQGNLTDALGAIKDPKQLKEQGKADLYDALVEEDFPVENAVQEAPNCKNLHILPGNSKLSRIERETDYGVNFWLLQRVIEPLTAKIKYDYIIIDTPPALGLLSALALTACKNGGVVIPAFPDSFSQDGILEFWKTLQTAKRISNPELRVLGILLTNHNPQTNMSAAYTQNYKVLANAMQTKVFNAHIRRNIKLAEAATNKENIATQKYLKNAPNLVADYFHFVNELLEVIEKGVEINE